MKNAIIADLRSIRKTLDNELHENPQKTYTRWKKIEKTFEGKIVHRNPKLLKKKAA